LNHPPDQCPTSNSKVRDRIQQQASQLPKLGERLGVKITAGPFVLGAEHETVAVVEADRVEGVNDFLMESGLIQWNSARVSMAQLLPDALGELDKVPAPLY
jgi:hypothetical protein